MASSIRRPPPLLPALSPRTDCEAERSLVALQVTRLVLTATSKQAVPSCGGPPNPAAGRWARLSSSQCPRQRGRKLLQQAKRIVATLQPHAIVKLSEDTSRSTVEAICEAITLHGPPFRPYDIIRLLCHELRLQSDLQLSLLTTLDMMIALLPTISLVDCAREAIGKVVPDDLHIKVLTAPPHLSTAGGGGFRRRVLIGKDARPPAHNPPPPRPIFFSSEGDAFVDGAAKGNINQVDDALQRGVDIEVIHSLLLYNALTAACDFGHLAMVELLLAHGANIHSRCLRCGRSPLHWAAESGRQDICRLLIAKGALRHLLDADSKRASELAQSSGIAMRPRLKLVEVLSEVPGRITSLSLNDTRDTSLTLAWCEPIEKPHQAPIDSYLLEWRRISAICSSGSSSLAYASNSMGSSSSDIPDSGPEAPPTWHSITTKETTYTLTGLHCATVYAVRITPRNGAGYGPPSRVARLQTLEGPPEVPGTAVLLTSTPTSITLLWMPPPSDNGSPITQYEIQRSIIVDVKRGSEAIGQTLRHPWTTERMLDAATTFTSSGLPPFSKCVFRIRARNDLGWSDFSPQSQLLKADDALHSIHTTPTSLHLEWCSHPLQKVLAYELQMRAMSAVSTTQSPDYETLALNLQDVPGLSVGRYLVQDLEPASLYQFRVRKKDFKGWQQWADATVSPLLRTSDAPPDPPNPPKSTLESVGDFCMELCWTPNSCNGPAITIYEVEAMMDRDNGWNKVGATKDTTLVAKKLLGGKIYTFRVRAFNSQGWSEWSEPGPSMYMTFVPAPGAPTVVSCKLGRVELTWKEPGVALIVDKYEIRLRSQGESEPTPLPCVPTNRAVLSSLKPRVTYYVSVRAMTVLGPSSWSLESEGVRTSRRF